MGFGQILTILHDCDRVFEPASEKERGVRVQVFDNEDSAFVEIDWEDASIGDMRSGIELMEDPVEAQADEVLSKMHIHNKWENERE